MLFDPERRWLPQGICRWEDRHLFFAKGGAFYNRRPGTSAQEKWDQAKEICADCPVLEQCRRDTLGENYGVWGGYDEHQRWKIRSRLAAAARKWPPEKRRAWALEIHRLREGGLFWRDITLMTGVPAALAEVLAEEGQEHAQEARRAPAKVITLPLPEPGPRKPEFPVRAGRRHAWVRHNGRISDAIYRGETPTGTWVFVTVYSGHGHVNKWVLRRDVQIYHPQPVIVMSKRKEKPDAPAPECEPAA